MTAEKLQKNITIDELNHLIDTGHVYRFPFAINREVYIISNHKPSKVMVTDMSVKGIQLNGQWYSEKEIDEIGGVYGSEFEALSAVSR
ncbi:MAG: hypothetical protein LKF52_15105 [Butyrivibrio sp.]|jgi:hypothetical protein|nr:hypothetical protein [Butyrivibrio sp.]